MTIEDKSQDTLQPCKRCIHSVMDKTLECHLGPPVFVNYAKTEIRKIYTWKWPQVGENDTCSQFEAGVLRSKI